MEESAKYTDTFRQEAEEILSDIEMTILDLEQNPNDKEAVNRLFRGMHTIKGSGAMFGFDDIASFTHHVETVLDHVRDNRIPVSGDLINLILVSRDHIKSMFDAIDSGEKIDIKSSERLITALQSLLQKQGKDVETSEKLISEKAKISREKTFRIRFKPNPNIFKSGMDPVILIEELREIGECMIVAHTEDIPTLDELITDNCYLSWDVILTTMKDIDTIRGVFIFVEDESRLTIQAIEDYVQENEDTVPLIGEILLERGDINSEKISEALGQQKRIGELLIDSGAISPEKIKSALDEQKILGLQKKKAMAGSVRVSSDKLDYLINLVGELVITQAHLSQLVGSVGDIGDTKGYAGQEQLLELFRSRLANPIETLERLTDELRDCALNMRMVPIGSTFSRFRRLVRDLSAELGKDIELVTEGAETELDKTVIERLNDPLVHLIRNSIDHGIQTPEERKKMGKLPKGTIRLMAEHRGANVVIVIEDDGIGLDPDIIRKKAVEKGLIAEGIEITEKEMFNLIFMPGFSTVKQVTSVSGRGVGMDVVRREIDSLGGSIRTHSKKGEYLRISLSLPLTLAIIDGLLVEVGERYFVLPLAQVEECAELTQKLIEKSHGRNMISIRDELIPFIRLREVFGISDKKPALEHIAIAQVENFRAGIVADEIRGTIQTVIKSLDKNYRDAEGISGATIMGDGTVALIIDIPGLIRCAAKEEETILRNHKSHHLSSRRTK